MNTHEYFLFMLERDYPSIFMLLDKRFISSKEAISLAIIETQKKQETADESNKNPKE